MRLIEFMLRVKSKHELKPRDLRVVSADLLVVVDATSGCYQYEWMDTIADAGCGSSHMARNSTVGGCPMGLTAPVSLLRDYLQNPANGFFDIPFVREVADLRAQFRDPQMHCVGGGDDSESLLDRAAPGRDGHGVVGRYQGTFALAARRLPPSREVP